MKALLSIYNPDDMAILTQVLKLAQIRVASTDDLFKTLETLY